MKKQLKMDDLIRATIGHILFVIPIFVVLLIPVLKAKVGYYYLITAETLSISSLIILILFRKMLLWNLLAGSVVIFSGIILGTFVLMCTWIESVQVINASLRSIFLFFSLIFLIYTIMLFSFHLKKFDLTKKQRYKSFDFEAGTYDISTKSLISDDAHSDYYEKSWLLKAHWFLVRFSFAGIFSGSMFAILIGKFTRSGQLAIGILACWITIIGFLQVWIIPVQAFYQVCKLQMEHKKWFRLIEE